jgi:putative copper resistance protein D
VVSALVRGAAQMALLALAGLLALVTWGGTERTERLRYLERVLVVVTPVLLAADFFLWLQHAAPQGQVNFDTIADALGTQNGAGYALRVGLGLGAVWAMLLARAYGLAAAFAVLALVVTGATGHPAAISPSIAIPGKIIHLAAAALWTGGLIVLGFGQQSADGFQKDAWRVSKIALISVVAIALTGAVETLLFLPRLSDLVSSAYGWLIIAKLAGLGVLVAFGFRNRYKLMPRMAESGPGGLQRSVTWETAWMVGVVILAAFLAYIPPPPGEGVAMPVSHQHEIMEDEH